MENKNIKKLISDTMIIFLLVTITMLTIPNIINKKKLLADTLISNSSSFSVNITKNNNYALYPMTDKYAEDNLNKNRVTVSNTTNKAEKYNLILKISKESSIEINNLKLKVEDKIIKLDNYSYEDTENFYYLIYSDCMDKKQNANLDYILWLDENSNMITGNDLIYSFEVNNI